LKLVQKFLPTALKFTPRTIHPAADINRHS